MHVAAAYAQPWAAHAVELVAKDAQAYGVPVQPGGMVSVQVQPC